MDELNGTFSRVILEQITGGVNTGNNVRIILADKFLNNYVAGHRTGVVFWMIKRVIHEFYQYFGTQ